jgi:hypothetical protein
MGDFLLDMPKLMAAPLCGMIAQGVLFCFRGDHCTLFFFAWLMKIAAQRSTSLATYAERGRKNKIVLTPFGAFFRK